MSHLRPCRDRSWPGERLPNARLLSPSRVDPQRTSRGTSCPSKGRLQLAKAMAVALVPEPRRAEQGVVLADAERIGVVGRVVGCAVVVRPGEVEACCVRLVGG